MTNCVIEDAISDVDGTAVFIRGDSSAVIDSWIIRNNDGSDGGGPAVTINRATIPLVNANANTWLIKSAQTTRASF